MMVHNFSRFRAALVALLVCFCLGVSAQSRILPRFTAWSGDDAMMLSLPAALSAPLPEKANPTYVVLQLDPDWAPADWKKAAFDLKGLIVAARGKSAAALVGIDGSATQIEALLSHELAAYLDGYIYEDEPFLPKGDPTGKLWLRTQSEPHLILSTLLDAASIGVEVVFLKDSPISAETQGLIDTLSNTRTGSLDLPPGVTGIDQERTVFFLDPASGNYHLAVFPSTDGPTEFSFPLSQGTRVEALYPEKLRFRHRQLGETSEILVFGDAPACFFLLEPGEKAGTSESLEIVSQKIIDPYELVVKNQVFKEQQDAIFRSLEVDEELNYRYQAAGGVDIDITYKDTVIERKDEAIERIRRETYIGGVKWRAEKQPELPLIYPEKVQTAPLVIDLDKSYEYTYAGEAVIDGFPCWRVRFKPRDSGNFYSGTVWIDQETGAHRKIRALQSGLEPPVVGNEMTVFYDWVEDGGQRYWTQVRESNMQLINVVGERLTLLIDSFRNNYRFNREDMAGNLAQAYASKLPILRDTPEGFRYLIKKKNGEREVSESRFLSKKAVLGGVLFDPALDSPIPLAGFNYTDLSFRNTEYQANFFLAGAINDLIISNPNFLGKGLDFTAELFLTPLYFGDSVYNGDEELEELEVESLRESFNVTLGVPLNTYWKFSTNYALRYHDFKEGDETDENYVLPQSHLEHVGRFNLAFSRGRLVTDLQYSYASRSDWEAFGLPGDSDGVEDSYSKLKFDASLSKRLPKFQSVAVELGYLKGWNLDRFSRFGFGFFENRVAGFGSSGIKGDEAYKLEFEYEIGVSGLFNVELSLDGARALLSEPVTIGSYTQPDEVDLAGLGVAVNMMGPWGTLIRMDMGYGVYSSLPQEEGDFSGQLVFLKLF